MRTLCLEDFFCPTGSADELLGALADDSMNRGLSLEEVDPELRVRNVRLLSNDDMRVVADHEDRCLNGVDGDLMIRYATRYRDAGAGAGRFVVEQPKAGDQPAEIAAVPFDRPAIVNEARARNKLCGRDHKWRHVRNAIARDDCDCRRQLDVVIAVYRLWKCRSSTNGTIENLGLAAVEDRDPSMKMNVLRGGRDYWFPERKNRTLHQCVFPTNTKSGDRNLTHGAVYLNHSHPTKWPANDLREAGLTYRLEFREPEKTWATYEGLKGEAADLYYAQKQEVRDTYATKATGASIAGLRTNVDHMVFDVHRAVRLIEEYGEYLEQGFIALEDEAPVRYDMCDCQNLLKCPNGTSSPLGSSELSACRPCCSGVAGETSETCWTDETLTCATRGAAMVLRRYDALPTWAIDDYDSEPGRAFVKKPRANDALNFDPLTGTEGVSLGHLRLGTYDVATITSDLTDLDSNFTYRFPGRR